MTARQSKGTKMAYPAHSSLSNEILVLDLRALGDSVVIARTISTFPAEVQKKIVVAVSPTKFEIYQSLGFNGKLVPFLGSVTAARLLQPHNLITLSKSIIRFRRKYCTTVNFYSDFRENLVSFLLGSRRRLAPRLPHEHVFKKTLRPYFLFLNTEVVNIERTLISVYQIFQKVLTAALGEPVLQQAKVQTKKPIKLGVHPFASGASRMVPLERWPEVVLKAECRQPVVFFCGTIAEEQALRSRLAPLEESGKVQILRLSLGDFINKVRDTAVVVAMDSFASHVVSAVGTRLLYVPGSNHSELWRPPQAKTVRSPHIACSNYPCMNQLPCLGSTTQFECIRSVTTGTLVDAIKNELAQLENHEA